MKYLGANFTLPASSNTSQERWDFSILTETQFLKKYDIAPRVYERVVNGFWSIEEALGKA